MDAGDEWSTHKKAMPADPRRCDAAAVLPCWCAVNSCDAVGVLYCCAVVLTCSCATTPIPTQMQQ